MTRPLWSDLDATSRLMIDLASSKQPKWRGPLGPEQTELVHRHGLTALIATHSRPELRDRAIAPFTRLQGRQQVMTRHLRVVLDHLRAAAVPAAVLKGPDLGTRVYSDPRHRTFTDIDLLVPKPDLERALDALKSVPGVGTIPRKRPKADKRDIPLMDETGMWFMIDLHWDLFSYSQLRGCANGAVDLAWDRSREVDSPLGPARLLPSDAYTAFLCTHALLDHRFRLILFRDLAEMARKEIEWEELTRFADTWRLRTFVYLAMLLAQETAGAEIPEGFLADIRPRSRLLSATEKLIERADPVRFDGHRPDLLNLAMVLLHDERSERVRLALHAPAAIPAWMHRFGRTRQRPIATDGRIGRPPRVLVLVTSDQRRGAEVFGENLVGRLREEGWDADLVALVGERGSARVETDLILSEKPSIELGRLEPGIMSSLRGRMREWRPDVVLANGGATLRYAALARFGMRRQARLVYMSIGEPRYWIRGPAHRAVQSLLHRMADLVIAVSEATRDQLIEFVGVPETKVAVAHTGVPEELTSISGHDHDGSINLLFLGSLSPEKNPHGALDLLERIAGDGGTSSAVLRFVGTGPLEEELRFRAAHMGPDQVQFSGAVDDVGPHLEWAHILILPSITEGLPGAVLEAGAAGVPSVAMDVGGTGEAIVPGRTGLLVPAGNFSDMAQAIESLRSDPDSLSRMGQAARAYVIGDFLLADSLDRYTDLLTEMLPEPGRRGWWRRLSRR